MGGHSRAVGIKRRGDRGDVGEGTEEYLRVVGIKRRGDDSHGKGDGGQ
jgi:hypothetical protein